MKRHKEIIRKMQIENTITLKAGIPKEKVAEFLEPQGNFINTTNYDNKPISVIEAMACGLCIVSTNVGGISYLLEDEKDALLVPPDNS